MVRTGRRAERTVRRGHRQPSSVVECLAPEQHRTAEEAQTGDKQRKRLEKGRPLPCPTSVCSDSLLSYASGYGHTQIANSFQCPWEIHGPHPYRCAYMPSNPRDGCVGVPNLHDLCALHHTLCLGMRGQEQVVDMLMTHGADGMQRDDGSDSCLSLSPPGRCVSLKCW